jgi:Uma2 family endonuclease
MVVASFVEKQYVVLPHISWQTYEAILADAGDRRSSRFTYDRGVLEIRMPSDFHEAINRLLARIVTILTEELNLPLKEFGSVTLNRKDLEGGSEPDSSFYIQNADRIRGRRIDITIDPPPDLVIEVDITSSSVRSFEVYQRLGILEAWRYNSSGVRIYRLQDGKYLECEFSPTFPMISGAVLDHFLRQPDTMDDNAVIRTFRTWLREQLN